MSQKPMHWAAVLGLALSLPSLILGAFYFLSTLVESGIISETTGLIVGLLVVLNSIFLMVRYVLKKKNSSP